MQGTSMMKISMKIFLCIFLMLVFVQGVQAAETYQFVTKWGTEGTGDGQFEGPYGIAVDSSGNVYVTDMTTNCIQKFSSSGVFLGKWGSKGAGDGQFNGPDYVAVDPSGNVYVSDRYNCRIQKFSSSGVFLGKWGTSGDGDGQFRETGGVAADSFGNVYVVDVYNNRIQKFSPSGTFLTKWGSYGRDDGHFVVLYGVAVDSSGNVYTVEGDDVTSRIQKFSPSGTFLMKWGGAAGFGDGQLNHPTGVAVDNSGNVFVTDADNTRVQKLGSGGEFLTKWGSSGSGNGQFNGVADVAVDSSGNIYVTDSGNYRIQKFAPNPQSSDFTGSWTMGGPDGVLSFGNCMVLAQSGSQVTGNYPHDQGRLTGTVTGNTFSGVWAEAPTYTGSTDSGKLVATLSNDGKTLSGTWGYGDVSTGYSWTGTKSSAVCPVVTPTLKPLSVTAISPSTGTNVQSITATVTGTGFKPGAVAKLTFTGQPDIVASGMTLTGDTLIICTFDLSGKSTGVWNLAVTNPGDGTTSVRSNAFTLTALHTYGWIIVSSNPTGADVFIDAVQRGTTPATFTDIIPGTHSVTVSKIGYLGQYSTITVSQQQPSTVDVTLEPLKVGTGIISVRSTPPGASIVLDGQYTGKTTPYDFYEVTPGVHTLEVSMLEYGTYPKTITVDPGTTVVVTTPWSYTEKDTVVFFSSDPDGANVYIDDSMQGVTPLSLHLKKGTYIVKMTKEGYEDNESALYVSSADPIQVTKTLQTPGFGSILALISLVAVVMLVRKFRK